MSKSIITPKFKKKLAKVETKRQALTLLRSLGYSKAALQMTRVATTYRHENNRLGVSIGEHNFTILDLKKTHGNNWSFLSMALGIGNLANGTQNDFNEKVEKLLNLGVLDEGQEVNINQLAVAMVAGCHEEERLIDAIVAQNS